MKKKTKLLSLITTTLAGLALSLGVVSGVSKKESTQVDALYTPSTTYNVSDTESELASYYSSVTSGQTGDTLLGTLRSINSSKYHKNFSYSDFGTSAQTSPYVYTDYPIGTTTKDSNGQIRGSSIASFYTKTTATSYNKEHVWPNSKGGNKVENDILMPRPTISSENSSRGNSNFVEGMNSSSGGWDPYTAGYDIACRGECARIMLYCVVASSQLSLVASNTGGSTSCGNMNTLIKWHFDYAPSEYEMNRNNGAEYLQGNRNPFVDHPEYVAKIWSNFNSTISTLCSQNESKYSSWTPGNYCPYGTNDPVNPNVGVTISKDSESLTVGSSTTISATSSNNSTISWTTSNSSIVSLSSSSSASGSNITLTANGSGTATITAKITVSGTQYSATCTVTVTKVVSSLSKGSTSPTKTVYTAGEHFDPTGLTITATYSDSTQGNVTSSVVWSPDPLTAGTTSVTGTYGGKTIVISGLTVNEPTEPEIIDSNSDLSVGDYVVLRTAAGIGVTGWNNNKDATVSETQSEWKKYYVASASNSGFTLKDESANSFIASPGSSNQFTYGSAATCSTNSDGHLICNNRYLCKNGTNYRFYSSISSYLPFFVYRVPGSSTTKTLSSISVSTAPTKTTYTAGETFDPTGLVITRTYSDSTTDTYAYAGHTSEFTFSPTTSTALTTSNVSVTITYGGKSTSQAITVNSAAAKTLSSITISGYTTSFTLDESFSFGGTVTANFSDSTSSNVTASATFSGYNMSVAGNYTVTVSYTYGGTTKTAQYQITVNASGGGGGEPESFSGTYNYGNQGTGTGKTWSLTDCSDQSSYWLCPNSGDTSVALIPGIFSGKTISSDVVITINSGTYGSGGNPSSSTFAIYTSSACTSQITATQTGELPTSKTYTDAIYTVSLANSSGFSDDLAIKITKPGKQIRLVSITVEFDYETSGSSSPTLTSISLNTDNVQTEFTVGATFTYSGLVVTAHYSDSTSATVTPTSVSTPDMSTTGNKTVTVTYLTVSNTYTITVSSAAATSITATVSKTFYVGDTISSSDITVKDNLNNDVNSFTFANDGYQFTYADAASGGALTNKTFTNAVSGSNLTCSLTVQVQRKARAESASASDSVTYTDLPTAYQTSTTERTAASGIKFIAYNLANYSSKMQFRASGGYFQTTEAMSLTSLTINNRETNALTVYGSTNGTSFSTAITGTNDVYDLTGYSYVKVMRNGSGAAYCASLTITYGGEDSALNLANYIMFEDVENQCTSKLNTAIGYLAGLSSTERTTFSTSEDYVISKARERLEAWALNQGKEINYASGELTTKSNKMAFGLSENDSSATLIIVIASMSVVSLSVLLIIKKRRLHN